MISIRWNLDLWFPQLKTLLIAVVIAALVAVGSLIYPIFFPTLVPYPWPLYEESSSRRRREKKWTVVMAGSFNPPHWGHWAMIQYLAQRFGQVVVVVGFNPQKTYEVTPKQRAELIRTMMMQRTTHTAPLLRPSSTTTSTSTSNNNNTSNTFCPPNVEVQVVHGYIWRWARRIGARRFFRGIRSWEKDGPEERQLHILNTWGPLLYGPAVWPIPTAYLQAPPAYQSISSTWVRNVVRGGGRRASVVPLTGGRISQNNDDHRAHPRLVAHLAEYEQQQQQQQQQYRQPSRRDETREFSDEQRTQVAQLVPPAIVDEVLRLYSPSPSV